MTTASYNVNGTITTLTADDADEMHAAGVNITPVDDPKITAIAVVMLTAIDTHIAGDTFHAEQMMGDALAAAPCEGVRVKILSAWNLAKAGFIAMARRDIVRLE